MAHAYLIPNTPDSIEEPEKEQGKLPRNVFFNINNLAHASF
jgi:hypothetical protein